MYCHPLPEGMKMDAYPLPECCYSSNSPFLIPFHTPPKSFGRGGEKKEKLCHSARKSFLEVEELRLVVSSCLLFVYYMKCRTLLRKYWKAQIIHHLPLPPLRSTDGLPLECTFESIPELTGQKTSFVTSSPWLQVLYSNWCLTFSKLWAKDNF